MKFTYTSATDPAITGNSTVSSASGGVFDGFVIRDSLINTSDVAQKVTYTITAWVLGADSSLRCGGNPDIAEVWVQPTPRVVPYPVADTICSGDALSIRLTSPTMPRGELRFDYVSELVTVGPVVGLSSGTGLRKGDTITDNLTNNTDDYQIVRLVITPYIINGAGITQCTDPAMNDTVLIWVEPRPRLNPIPDNDTICNQSRVSITLQSPTNPVLPVKFRYATIVPAGVSITSGPVANIADGFVITDSLSNTTDSAKFVRFVVTAYTTLSDGLTEKCTGTRDTIGVWVEPRLEFTATPTSDTLCNDTRTAIRLDEQSWPTMPLKFSYTVDVPAGVSITSGATSNLAHGFTITDSLHNSTDAVQVVTYHITSYSTLGDGASLRCTGITRQVLVYIEPSPKVDASPETDTLCNQGFTAITLASVTVPTLPVRFRYVVDAPAGVIINSGATTGLTVSSVISDQVTNNTPNAQWVTFIITPYTVNNFGVERCSGLPDTVGIWVEPTARVAFSRDDDTICNHTRINIQLSTPNTPTRAVKFRYTIEKDDASVDVQPGSGSNISNNSFITDSITNPGNSAQRVLFIVTPYITTGDSISEKCAGISDTIEVWVEPTPEMTFAPADTVICNNNRVSITMLSSNTPTKPIKFRYTYTPLPPDITITPGATSDLSNGFVVQDLFANAGDTARRVTFTSTPYTTTGNGLTERCAGDAVTVNVWIEPTAKVLATPSADTLCNETTIAATLTSPSVPTRPVKFRYTSTVLSGSAEVTVLPATNTNLVNNTNLANLITNSTDVAQQVRFIITAYTTQPNGIAERCTGLTDTIDIWVEPTPRFELSRYSDTICNHTLTDFRITSPTVPTSGIYFEYRSWAVNPALVEGEENTLIDSLPKLYSISDSITNLSAVPQYLTYEVQAYLTDGAGVRKACPANSKTAQLISLSDLKFDFDPRTYNSGHNLQCFNDNSGRIQAENERGGFLPFSTALNYQWSNGGANDIIEDLSATEYQLTLTDGNGCKAYDTITLTQPDLLTGTIKVTNPKCEGSYDGSVNYLYSGGTYGHQYTIEYHTSTYSIADTTYLVIIQPDSIVFLNMTTSTYYFSITDTNGCYVNDIAKVEQSERTVQLYINPKVTGYDYNLSCHGSNDGRIAVGGPIDTMYISPSLGTRISLNRIDTLPAGRYLITAIDTNDCLYEYDTVLTAPDPITIADYRVRSYPGGYNIRCFGEENGEIELRSVLGGHDQGFTPYTHIWQYNGDTLSTNSEELTNRPAGDYQLTIRDVANCTFDTSFVLTQPDSIGIGETIKTYSGGFNVSCEGRLDGEIELNVSGGHAPANNYQYRWADGSTSHKITGLKAASYAVTVTDEIACTNNKGYTLTEPGLMKVNYDNSDFDGFEISCFGENDGFIDLTPEGGDVGTYSYEWTSADGIVTLPDSKNQFNLVAGTYTLSLDDANGCNATASITLRQPDELLANLLTRDVSCDLNNMGSAVVSPVGGRGDYSVSWSSGIAGSGNMADNLTIGSYSVTITDGVCQASQAFDIIRSSFLELLSGHDTLFNGYPISCYGASDGTLRLSVSNGRPPYTYLWSNGSADSVLTNLPAGTYSVSVTDELGCPGQSSFTLTQPQAIEIITVGITDALCHNDSTGTIEILDVAGGITPYTYRWDDGTENNDLTDKPAGNYTIRIGDRNLCYHDSVLTISQPEALAIAFVPDQPYCPDKHDGSLEAIATGGAGGYTFVWSNGAQDNIATELNQNEYSVTITDFNRCRIDTSYLLLGEQETCLNVPKAFSPNGNNQNDVWVLTVDEGIVPMEMSVVYPAAIVEVYDRSGSLIYRSAPGYPQSWDGRNKGREVPDDSYFYIINLGGDYSILRGVVTIIR